MAFPNACRRSLGSIALCTASSSLLGWQIPSPAARRKRAAGPCRPPRLLVANGLKLSLFAATRCEAVLVNRCKSGDSVGLSDRLRSDTATLLAARLPAKDGSSRSLQRDLRTLQADELADLYNSVEALVATVDDYRSALGDDKGAELPPDNILANARRGYGDFLQALTIVEQAMLGAPAASEDVPRQSRSFAETQWWIPLVLRWRYHICSLFSWGLLPEDVVREASECLQQQGVTGILDPLAGSGWHARLWHDVGGMETSCLESYGALPIRWSQLRIVDDARHALEEDLWLPPKGSSPLPPADATGPRNDRWALYLSWPPHTPETVGQDLLKKYPGSTLVYLGERTLEDAGFGGFTDDGVTGGRAFLDELEANWEPVKTWKIPHWPGFSDDLTIYRRKR
eukprot:TRINITY_DN65004_c0_g1_i1.p1 TRINITY_DN65004_c0_g1~~TRINITY_DN65004_c0_g1_i1.p1  ORF type:complete len:427 (+),score=76.88 TRINITY_DN65004_c0_g1_i1:87-1283(+)